MSVHKITIWIEPCDPYTAEQIEDLMINQPEHMRLGGLGGSVRYKGKHVADINGIELEDKKE